jgi:hypothetical protein
MFRTAKLEGFLLRRAGTLRFFMARFLVAPTAISFGHSAATAPFFTGAAARLWSSAAKFQILLPQVSAPTRVSLDSGLGDLLEIGGE